MQEYIWYQHTQSVSLLTSECSTLIDESFHSTSLTASCHTRHSYSFDCLYFVFVVFCSGQTGSGKTFTMIGTL